MENVLREVFLDLELSALPVSFRIGRQQIVWGNTVNFRALDNTNSLDLSWHMQQEAGILGRVGFSELRIPTFAVKMLVKLPSVGPFADSYLEAYDIPFEFEPTERLRAEAVGCQRAQSVSARPDRQRDGAQRSALLRRDREPRTQRRG